MTFQTLQKTLLNLKDSSNLAKLLDYKNMDKFHQAIYKVANAKSLAKFLRDGHYDYIYTSKELVLKLASIYKIDINAELENAQKLNDELKKYKNSYIYIDTDFKRKNEPIFKIALMQGYRYVYFNKDELCFKSLKEQLEFISKIINNHYKNTKTLPLFGEITGYKFHHLKKDYDFDVNAKLTDKKIIRSTAWLKLA